MEKSRQYAVTTQENEKKFSFVERKVQKDCDRDEAALCVDAFCHSEEGSRVDTESKRVYKIKNPATCTAESHPAQVWNKATNENRHEAFLMSEMYRDFQQINGEDKTIGIQRFQENLCNCVREATPLSCVDLPESDSQEYMTAIKNAVHLHPVIRDKINRCNCDLHQSDCELGGDEFMNNEDISFNDLPKLSATKMI
jgi:hypothetical protein